MTDLDPQITAMLDQLVPVPEEAGDWERVLTDADAIEQPRERRRRAHTLALVLAAFAALAAGFAFAPALAGQGYFWFLEYGAPKPTTPVVTVTSITDRSGTTWQLTAYRHDDELCIQLTNAAGTREGAGGCASADMPLNAGVYGAGDPHGAFVFGPVTADAQTVEISGSGERVEAAAATPPEALQTDIKFYVAQLPDGMPGAPLTVKALDANGQVVATWTVPALRPTR